MDPDRITLDCYKKKNKSKEKVKKTNFSFVSHW